MRAAHGKIEIYCVESGRRGRLNEFRGDNATLQALGLHHPHYQQERERLLAHARRCAYAWQQVFPHAKIEVTS